MSALDIYFLLKLDAMIGLVRGIGVTVIMVNIATWIFIMTVFENECDLPDTEKTKIKHSIARWSIISAIFCFLCIGSSMMIPTTKEAVAIIVLPKIINSATNSGELEKLPEDIVAIACGWTRALSPDSIKCDIKSILGHAKTINGN
jgi:hypothetical protein